MRASWCVAAVLAACATPGAPAGDPQRDVSEMLARSAGDWNSGDLAGFMSDYARDSLTSFISGGRVRYGWQPMYDRYQEHYFAPGMSRDSLSFEDVRVRALTPPFAFATARFALHRGDSLVGSGPFTLVLERRDGRWLILHDHTSSDPKP